MNRQKAHHHPLTRWRFEYGVTIAAAAAELCCTPGYLSAIENWKKVPSLGMAERLVEMTGGYVKFSDFTKALTTKPRG